MNRKVYKAWELPPEIVEAIRNAKPSPKAEELNYLMDEESTEE